MTNEIQQARRDLFEAWVTREFPKFSSALYRRDAKGSNRYGEYVNETIEAFWRGFNAALDSISVELPDCTEFDFPSGAAPAIAECRAAIEQTNMGILIK